MPISLRDEYSTVHCSLHIDPLCSGGSLCPLAAARRNFFDIYQFLKMKIHSAMRFVSFGLGLLFKTQNTFFLELLSFHVEVTGRPEKPRWSCRQVGTEKAKTFHGGCSHVWNVGLSEDCPLHLPDLRLTAHFRLAPDSGFCATLTHLTSSRTFSTVAAPLLSTG